MIYKLQLFHSTVGEQKNDEEDTSFLASNFMGSDSTIDGLGFFL